MGTQRRVAVACKFMNCGQLLVLHDALFGVNEGDGLAVLKALSDMCRSAQTAAPPHTLSSLAAGYLFSVWKWMARKHLPWAVAS